MRLLLDTHVLLCALIEPTKLSPKTRAIIEDPEHDVLFSAASVWEMAIKVALGRADFRVALGSIVEAARARGFIELPVRSGAALRVAALPHDHRDPFDRLLVAQTITEPAALYTADAQLKVYSELVMFV
jgi:PIN domain nuclease of toxin-antitoxin system